MKNFVHSRYICATVEPLARGLLVLIEIHTCIRRTTTCTRMNAPTVRRRTTHSDLLEGIKILRLRASWIDLFPRNFHSAGARKSHAESSIKWCWFCVHDETRQCRYGARKDILRPRPLNGLLALRGRTNYVTAIVK